MTRTRRKYQNRKRVVNDSGQTDEKDALIPHEKVDTNADVLPAKPKGSKIKKKEVKEKQLSRKERRKLELIVKRKAVKQQRSEIIDALQKVQVSAEHTRFMVSTTTVYNGGDFSQAHVSNTDSAMQSQTQFARSSLRGANKQKKLQRSNSQSESESESESVATSAMSTDSEAEREVDEIDNRCTKQETQTTAESECQQVESLNVMAHEEPLVENTSDGTNALGAEKSTEASEKAQEEALKRIRKLFNVPVSRTEAVEVARRRLPVVGEEQAVMEAVNAHRVTIVCGETGSGKTTQVPQFLYEAGYASGAYRIAVTEPRRIAAISMSQRVAHELNGDSSLVGYRIRYENNVTPATRVIFMTDGVLLKEVQKDFLLRDYSVVVLDEVHERSVFTDILIGLLSRIVRVREKRGEPLKLILMSATLRVSDFTENRRLFSEPPPTLNIATRQFSVAVHFNRRTPPRTQYISAAFRKVIKVHATLPEGGVLVFVATANDVRALCAHLRKANERAEAKRQKMEETQAATQSATAANGNADAEVDLDQVSALPERPTKLNEPTQDTPATQHAADDVRDEQHDDDANADEDDPEAEERWLAKNAVFPEPMHLLPLYSLLPTAEQLRVFEPAPAGTRLIVVATNVAETSLTIPGIKYVVDSGLVKRKYYEKTLGISQFRIEWCSKASANQRAGRAGRVGPGHAYRLYSSAVFGDFAEFSEPEILERPLDDIVLQTKALGIDNVENFPFPNAPSTSALREAERVLLALGAVKPLDSRAQSGSPMTDTKLQHATVTRISELGERLAAFSVSPRCAKLLVLATQFDILDYAILLVAALSVPEVLLDSSPTGPNVANLRRTMLNTVEWRRLGDFGVLIKTVAAVEFTLRRERGLRLSAAASSSKRVDEVCAQFAVRAKAFRELMRLRTQLRSQIDAAIGPGNALAPAVKVSVDIDGRYVDSAQSCVDVEPLAPPTEKQLNLIRQCLVCVLCDHVLRRMPNELAADGDAGKRAARSSNEPRYEHMLMNDAVFVHPNSVMHTEVVTSQRSGRVASEYDYLLFGELGQNDKQTVYAKLICSVDVDWLHRLCEPYCEFGLSNDTQPVRYDSTRDIILCHRPVAYGSKAWPLGLYELEFPKGVERVKQFARLLVEGEVYDQLKRFVPALLFSPNVLIRSWCGLHARAAELVNRLLAADSIDCRTKLEAKWRSDRNFLLEEYASWLPQALYYQVHDVWPPCAAAALSLIS